MVNAATSVQAVIRNTALKRDPLNRLRGADYNHTKPRGLAAQVIIQRMQEISYIHEGPLTLSIHSFTYNGLQLQGYRS